MKTYETVRPDYFYYAVSQWLYGLGVLEAGNFICAKRDGSQTNLDCLTAIGAAYPLGHNPSSADTRDTIITTSYTDWYLNTGTDTADMLEAITDTRTRVDACASTSVTSLPCGFTALAPALRTRSQFIGFQFH